MTIYNEARAKHLGSSRGMAVLAAMVFFMVASSAAVLGIVAPASARLRAARDLHVMKQASFAAESAVEDAWYRVKEEIPVASSVEVGLGVATSTASVSDTSEGKRITGRGEFGGSVKMADIVLSLGIRVPMVVGAHSGDGGIYMENSAIIVGDAFSNGTIVAKTSNTITGIAASAGPNGRIENFRVGGDAFAHTIVNTIVEGDAYYYTAKELTVTKGSSAFHPNSPDLEPRQMPLTDDDLDELEAVAEAGGVIHVPGAELTIKDSVTIGPVKYDGDVAFTQGATISIAGPVWISGTLSLQGGAKIVADPNSSGRGAIIIAHKPSDTRTSSGILIENTATVSPEEEGPFVLLVSRNNDAELGGPARAIDIGNHVSGNIALYAPHGLVYLSNNSEVKVAYSYRIMGLQTAVIKYSEALGNAFYSTGDGDTYRFYTWREAR